MSLPWDGSGRKLVKISTGFVFQKVSEIFVVLDIHTGWSEKLPESSMQKHLHF